MGPEPERYFEGDWHEPVRVVVWQGDARWSPSPACLYGEDGSMVLLAPR
ncbi:hypothetical protein ACFPN7_39240 [Amycolatopsis halotolerans]